MSQRCRNWAGPTLESYRALCGSTVRIAGSAGTIDAGTARCFDEVPAAIAPSSEQA